MRVRITIFIFITIVIIQSDCVQDQAPVQAVQKGNTVLYENEIIDHDQEWAADTTRIIKSNLFIQHATLRIKPGAAVQLRANASITVMQSGGIIAEGTTTKHVRFVKETKGQSGWNHIYLSSNVNGDSCRFVNCTFDGGGADPDWPAAIFCQDVSPTILNCTISNSQSAGISLQGDCSAVQFKGNTITGCADVPIMTDLINAARIDSGSYTNNDVNEIRILNGEIHRDIALPLHNMAYHFTDYVDLFGATLSILPGTLLKFDELTGLVAHANSTLNLKATSDSPIQLTGHETTQNRWQGLQFEAGSTGEIDYCTIDNAAYNTDIPASIVINNASPTLTNSQIKDGYGYGIYLSGIYRPARFDNNIITRNTQAPVSANAANVSQLALNDYKGNIDDLIEIRGGAIDGLINQYTEWPKLNVPVYRIQGSIYIDQGTLVLSPGIRLEMSAQSSIEIKTGGELIANGSSGIITFTGIKKTAGYWGSIKFAETSSPTGNLLNMCIIENGGGANLLPGMIYCDRSSPTITNCQIGHSLTYGIYKTNGAAPYLLNNIFDDNLMGNLYP
ncbi:right-handed parallel beta-helix repeat-containing protein [candidate division KSB1 bacterium]|nr:right-handed parallel beta-helix repeat-containing protein [candidate division KSB1 bacterium]